MSISESKKAKVNKSNSNTLVDLFGFEAAKTRLQDEKNQKNSRNVEMNFKPWNIFVNCIDSYHGKRIVETLSEQSTQFLNSSSLDEEEIEEEEEEEEKGENDDSVENFNSEKKFPRDVEFPEKLEIIGTTRNKEYKIPEDVKVIVRKEKYDKSFIKEIFNCGYVIYDITEFDDQIEEAIWVLQEIADVMNLMEKDKPKAFKRSEEIHHFILISTIMTWALTKPLDPNDPDLPLTEADYKKRKCHPNFKNHIRCEREIMSIKKRLNIAEKLKTIILCSGITYGYEESSLDYIFKMGFMNCSFLPIYGPGNNILPFLHVQDLVSVVSMFLKNWPDLPYIVAVEQESISQKILVKKLSRAMATGKVKNIAKAEACQLSDVSQRKVDVITTSIRIDPVYIVNHEFQWHYELPLQQNIEAIIKEYKNYRNLLPIKKIRKYELKTTDISSINWIDVKWLENNVVLKGNSCLMNVSFKVIVLGPPASGKTRLAKRLAEHYGLHYVNVKQLIMDTIQSLTSEIGRKKDIDNDELIREETEFENSGGRDDEAEEDDKGDDDDDDDDDEEDEGDEVTRVDDLKQQLDEIRNNLAENNERLSDNILNKLLMSRLRSKECQNQGYILDGYPKTLEQAKMLFDRNEEEEGEYEGEEKEEDENLEVEDEKSVIMPEFVISLEACDEFLKERVIDLPEREVQWTHYSEEHMLRRLKEYKERNTDENTPLQFFDELEIHPLIISIEDDICPEMSLTFHQCIQKIGAPKKFEPSPEELERDKNRLEAEALSAKIAEDNRKKQEILKNKEDRERKMIEWTNLLQKLKEEEEEQLCILSEPLRHYLVKYVFPTLTQGLVQVAKLRPDDPVDYLAEYLFKENPEGKMFEPDYTETMSTLFDAIEKLQDKILPKEEIVGPEIRKYLKKENNDEINLCLGEKELISNASEEKAKGTERGDSERSTSHLFYQSSQDL